MVVLLAVLAVAEMDDGAEEVRKREEEIELDDDVDGLDDEGFELDRLLETIDEELAEEDRVEDDELELDDNVLEKTDEELDTAVDELLEPTETELRVPEIDELATPIELLDIEDVNETLTLDEPVKPLEAEDVCVEELEDELLQGTALQSGL